MAHMYHVSQSGTMHEFFAMTVLMSTARISSRKYFIPGCVGMGLDLDLRIRPAPAPAAAASGWAQVGGPTLGPSGWAHAGPKWVGPGYTDLSSLGLRSKNKVFKLSG